MVHDTELTTSQAEQVDELFGYAVKALTKRIRDYGIEVDAEIAEYVMRAPQAAEHTEEDDDIPF